MTLKAERHREILARLEREGRVLGGELGAALGISEDTIRRDLDELAAAGVLQRVRGGALPRLPLAPYPARREEDVEAKAAIAGAAARLVRDGQVILLDGGTTVVRVAERFPPDLRATVLTNSVPVAAALAYHPAIEVHLVGGQLRKEAQVLVGVPAIEALRRVRADLCFLGICSLHPEVGISVSDLEEAYVKRAMVEQAGAVVAVTGAAKLGTAAPYVVSPARALTHLVTERTREEGLLAPYRALGVAIVTA